MTDKMTSGTYIGTDEMLVNKRALICVDVDSPTRPVLAQFDDELTGLSHGWHQFKREEFRLAGEEPVNANNTTT